MGLISELRRRNVLRMGALYLVAAWLIMQVAEVVLTLGALPEWLGQATLLVLVVGFPVALLFSWFYELTSEGVVLEKEVEPGTSITHTTGRQMDFIVIALLCAAVMVFAVDKWWPRAQLDLSIAVLPFAAVSDDSEISYLADGISEEIRNALGPTPGLRVISRRSSEIIKEQNLDTPTIAEELSVTNLLDGSVQVTGSRVRVSAQLIDAHADAQLWSNVYERNVSDTFAIQKEIADAVKSALRIQLDLDTGAAPKTSTVNPAAHEAYLLARRLRELRSGERAMEVLGQSLELDPDYALAHAYKAIFILGGCGLVSWGSCDLDTAKFHAIRAMDLDPNLAEAYYAAGRISGYEGEKEKAIYQYEQAIALNPNFHFAYERMAIDQVQLGLYAEAFTNFEVGRRLDPLALQTRGNYILTLFVRRQFEQVEREIELFADASPERYLRFLSRLERAEGNWADAVTLALQALQVEPRDPNSKRQLQSWFAAMALEKEALGVWDRTFPVTPSSYGNVAMALQLAEAGLAESPTDPLRRALFGQALAAIGDFQRARPILEEIWQLSGHRVTGGLFDLHRAIALIAVYREAGNEEGIKDLLDAVRDDLERLRRAEASSVLSAGYNPAYATDYQAGLLAFFSGETEQGLSLITKAVEMGFIIPPNEAYLRDLYDHPEYAPIRMMQQVRAENLRNEFLSSVCAENPYADVWQPAPGTCEEALEANFF